MKFKMIKLYYGSVTMFRVVRKNADGSLSDVNTYTNQHVAKTITKHLNDSVGDVDE